MVGFPGERDDDFTRTISAANKAAFSKIHVFKYSPREHTTAYMMPGQVSEDIKSSRSIVIRNLGDRLRKSYLESNIGKTLDVVCEEIGNCNVPADNSALRTEDIHEINEEFICQDSEIIREKFSGSDSETIYTKGSAICYEATGVIMSAKTKGDDVIASGTSGNYIKVYFKIEKSRFSGLKGKIVRVTADSLYRNGLFGTLN
jgi:hypothetical protein